MLRSCPKCLIAVYWSVQLAEIIHEIGITHTNEAHSRKMADGDEVSRSAYSCTSSAQLRSAECSSQPAL